MLNALARISYVFHEVLQHPTEPAYKKAVELKKEDRLTKPNYELKKIVKKFESVNVQIGQERG
ncbi:hypothetical protein OESDEN_07497 [Oesophagostomum dentatum]|uniref:Uncharacterized protein n=1 Tax=Oesophagostomum dentatum TaxID=61180 RepID=A0A0B1TBA7_OESDE|nr:hypothetical protein OESDEN_07497 [Oesophagostomum dentatum]